MASQPLGGTAIKPVGWDRTGMEAFRYLLYNPDTGAILHRTPASWFKITIFYIIYYSLLALFWVGCLQIFFTTIPVDKPKWILDASVIGSNPGVGLRPGMMDSKIDSSIYMLNAGSEDMDSTNKEGEGEKNIDYAVRMKKFLDKYSNSTGLMDCENELSEGRAPGERNCKFDLNVLDECGEYPYGYVVNDRFKTNVVQPCFLVKLNKIYDWVPHPIDPTELDDPAYDKMPENLKTRVRKAIDKESLWIDCFGRYPADKEAVSIEYFPEDQGIPLKYFPYRGGNYHQPLVAIKVHQSQVNDKGQAHFGQLIHLECRAWYKGVRHNTKEKSGLVQFELMLEPSH